MLHPSILQKIDLHQSVPNCNGNLSITSRKFIFAPYYNSGFDFEDTWVQHSLQHLWLLIGQLCHQDQDQPGSLLKMNIDILQLLHGQPPSPTLVPLSE